jgi:hypothetical protein
MLGHEMDSLLSFVKDNPQVVWNLLNSEAVCHIFKQILEIF